MEPETRVGCRTRQYLFYMERVKKLANYRVMRFVIVGVGNTAVNFAILNFAFYVLNQGKLVSSFIATACAVLFSFILNRNFVFRDHHRPVRQLVLFIVVTVSGVVLVQNSVYALGLFMLNDHGDLLTHLAHNLTRMHLSADFIDVNLSNALASLVVMFWNYNGYRLFVFKEGRPVHEAVTEAA